MWLFCKDLKSRGSAWRCGIETNKGRLGRVGRIKTAELPAVIFITPPQSQNPHVPLGLQWQ